MRQKKPNLDGIDKKSKQTNRPYSKTRKCIAVPSKTKPHNNTHAITKIKSKIQYFVGIDMHKKFMQVAVMDLDGQLLSNQKIDCKHETVKEELSKLPKNAKYVIESSSVWYGMYRMLTDEMNLDVILSNPYANRLIAESKKKTDKVDARILADLLRGGYISSAHVPSEKVVHNRQLVKYRSGIAHDITRFKNRIHGILLQEGTIMNSFPFTKSYIQELHELDDWRIDLHLKNIASVQESRAVANLKITQAVKEDLKAQLLATIPGVGEYTALTLSAAIDDVARFPDADHLISYFGLAPSVRNSANTTKYGSITKTGTSLVRKLLTECVIVHTSIMKRKDKNTPISEFYARLAKKRGTPKARVATAAKMIRIIYWMLKKKIDFE